jgi:hypothetical protein
LAWPRVLFLFSLCLLLDLGLVGIHIPGLMASDSHLLLGIVSISAIALAGLFCYFCHVVCVTVWLEDFCQDCCRACAQPAVGVEEAELMLARFNSLATCLQKEYIILFTVNQIVIIFSIYNTITGKYLLVAFYLKLRTQLRKVQIVFWFFY